MSSIDVTQYTPNDVKANLRRYLNMRDAAQRIADTQLGKDIHSLDGIPASIRHELPDWYLDYLTWTSLCRPPVVTERQSKIIDWNMRRRTADEMARDIGYVSPAGRDTLTQAEIAQVLCVSVDTVSRDLREALEIIRDRIQT